MAGTAGRLRELRRSVSFTQEELARRSGLSRLRIAALETGRLKCRFAETRRALARAYDSSLDALDAYLEGELALINLLEHRDERLQVLLSQSKGKT